MKRRNPFAVFILSLITLGIYDIYWLVTTKKELNQKTRVHTPTIWLLFAPVVVMIIVLIIGLVHSSSQATQVHTFNSYSYSTTTTSSVNGAGIALIIVYVIAILVILPISFYWFFKFSKAVNEYTNGKMSTGVTFLLVWLVHLVGVALVQDAFNDMLDAGIQPGAGSQQPASGPMQPMTPTTSVPFSAAPQNSPPPQNMPGAAIVSPAGAMPVQPQPFSSVSPSASPTPDPNGQAAANVSNVSPIASPPPTNPVVQAPAPTDNSRS